jgi:hypothetical protein
MNLLVLTFANNLLSERHWSSLKEAGTTPTFLLVLISYFRFDHSYPNNTELLLFLLFLLSSCPAFLVRSAYGRTTTQSAGSEQRTHFSHLLGIMESRTLLYSKTLFSSSLFRTGIAAAG